MNPADLRRGRGGRRGAILPLFTVVLPVILIIGAIAINLASLQLARTELKVSTDAAARAGGRAWSEFQNFDTARSFARQAAALNTVGGEPVNLDGEGGSIAFGAAIRQGTGRYQFDAATASELAERRNLNAVEVTAVHPSPLVFTIGGTDQVRTTDTSVSSQVDRDIALVIDRSGSMAYHIDEQFLFDTITDLYNDPSSNISENDYIAAVTDFQGVPELAQLRLADRRYPDSVLSVLSGGLLDYARTFNDDYRTRNATPQNSRWSVLEQANRSFLNFLEGTEQEELVSVTTFAEDARIDQALSDNYASVTGLVSGIIPSGATAIGDGMEAAVNTLYSADSRPFAIKTMVVFSDGVSNHGKPPLDAGRQLKDEFPDLIIHTITFSQAAAIEDMQELAQIGEGLHFHANTGDELIDAFEQLAASFRTIIVE